jgi:hypothetical protein
MTMTPQMTSAWALLEGILREERQFRGATGIAFTDLNKLVAAITKEGAFQDPNTSIRPEGGAFSCKFSFDPAIWGHWFPTVKAALAMGSTDKDVENQYAGRSQGHMVHKTNWGQRVVGTPGKARSDFERLPSAMDRYDVLMVADITSTTKRKRTGEIVVVKAGLLHRLAYAPSMGSSQEREQRLMSLMSGQSPGALPRRPQPHRPEPTKADLAKAAQTNRPAQPVPRVGQNLKVAADDDDDEVDAALGHLAGSAGDTSSFRSKMAKHNAAYQPSAKKKSDEPDDDSALFPKKKK